MENKHDVSYLIRYVERNINDILKVNLYEAGLSEDEVKRLRSRKNELRYALTNCGIGDNEAKGYIKDLIKDILKNKLNFGSDDYDMVISFSNTARLSARDKFEILLYKYKRKNEYKALEVLIEKSGVINENIYINGCTVTTDDINRIYKKEAPSLTEGEKADIVVQRIYAGYRGLGVIDDIRDMTIDGVSGGVSGTNSGTDGVWIFYKGINIHMEFLSFETEEELERVCMNIYRYGNPGQLSKSKGYIIGEMKDRSRVVVVRPPFAESFAFFVRKFGSMENKDISELITDKESEIPIDIIKWIIKGCQVTAITGAQGSGKTTLLMSVIKYISPALTLRIQEMAFELHLRDIYPKRNILTFRETDYINGQTGLDVQKKTDGLVNILGEVATIEVASYLIQMSQVGSLFTLFTHHAKSTQNLVKYMRNSLLSCGIFRDELIATQQVVDAIRFDVHMEKNIYGHRYIERITEIVPEENTYRTVDIVVFENNRYVLKNQISIQTKMEIAKHLSDREKEMFFEQYSVQNMS